MPTIPKNKRFPWQPEPDPQGGRKVKTKFYHTTSWRKVRAQYIKAHPLCEQCLLEDISTVGTVVDHIKPINRKNPYQTMFGVYGDPFDEANLQTLCEHHHAIKSARERWGK